MNSDINEAATYSRYSCTSCKRLKKKCDRKEPKCSPCQRYGRSCLYLSVNSASRPKPSPGGSASTALFGSSKPPFPNNGFPAVYFSDSSLFRYSLGRLPETNIELSADLLLLTEDISVLKQDVDTYFRHIHPWAPFLSRRNILAQVMSPLGGHRLDHNLLLCAIKLVITAPDDDPGSAAYYEIKSSLLHAEVKGILTFRILQALVLVSLYEMGHAIYPSAYLTVGYCVKYGIALGINRTIDSNQGEWPSLAQSEEERRTWWAIILLDRLTNLGCPERTPAIEEPDSTSILPMDDALWDTGYTAPERPPTLSSLPSGAMGRFALTVQAAFLLGRVLRNGRLPQYENDFQEEEAKILDKAILALTQVSMQESQQRGMGLCSPTTICHSARLILNSQIMSWVDKSPDNAAKRSSLSESQLSIASEMLGLAQNLYRTGLCGREESSPFCLDAMYRSAVIYGQVCQTTTTSDLRNVLEDFQKGFKANNRRWKAAGVFLQLIQARTITGSS